MERKANQSKGAASAMSVKDELFSKLQNSFIYELSDVERIFDESGYKYRKARTKVYDPTNDDGIGDTCVMVTTYMFDRTRFDVRHGNNTKMVHAVEAIA